MGIDIELVAKRLSEMGFVGDGFRELMEDAYKSVSAREISDICDVSQGWVLQQLKKMNIQLRPRGGPNHQGRVFFDLDEWKIMTIDQIASKCNCNPDYVIRKAKKLGYPPKRSLREKLYGKNQD